MRACENSSGVVSGTVNHGVSGGIFGKSMGKLTLDEDNVVAYAREGEFVMLLKSERLGGVGGVVAGRCTQWRGAGDVRVSDGHHEGVNKNSMSLLYK